MSVIECRGVEKTFRRMRGRSQRAVDRLDLLVEEGGVHGFLGPNGSGKTTTIRLLLGLVRADAGELRVLDRRVPDELPAVIPQVGALVEAPLFFPAFSGRRNLRLLAGVAGVPHARVEEVLEQVGLRERGNDRVRTYSLGMKQRLGVAAALLKKPRLLILDEPSNGLDPAGIREMREMIRRLGTGGVTVFLSSHLLGEVEQVCDSVDILSRGRRIAGGRVSEVLAARASGEVRVGVPDLDTAARILVAAGYAVAPADGRLLVAGATDPGAVTRTLAEQGHYVTELTPVTESLESVFLHLTEESA